jgi:hypothetical protein
MSHNVIEPSVVAYELKSTKNNLLKSTLKLKNNVSIGEDFGYLK